MNQKDWGLPEPGNQLFRAWQERLRAAMHQWEETKGDEGALLRGVPLAEAEEKLKERREELSPSEQNYIQQSLESRDRLRREEKNGHLQAARWQYWRSSQHWDGQPGISQIKQSSTQIKPNTTH